MAKQKRVSISAIEKVIKENYTPTETIDWHGVEITIKHSLSLEEMMKFVSLVTNSCFSESGEYIPESKAFVIKNCVIESYTNIALPSNTSSRYDLIYKSDIVSIILPHIDMEQFNAISEAIDKKIENIARANVGLVNKKAVELFSSIENIQEQFSNLMSGVTAEDIARLARAISNSTLDEKKLVEAYKSEPKPKIKAVKFGDE